MADAMSAQPWPAASGAASAVRSAAQSAMIHWPATLAAKGRAALTREHLRRRAAAGGGELHCVVLDASGSMQHGAALARAKGLALDLLASAVSHGHRVALLALSGGRVLPLAPPQPARRALAVQLAAVGGGGGTPLAQALDLAERWLIRARRRSAPGGLRTRLWVLTDGRSTHAPARPAAADHCTVIDLGASAGPAEHGGRAVARVRGRAQAWALAWGADYLCPPVASGGFDKRTAS